MQCMVLGHQLTKYKVQGHLPTLIDTWLLLLLKVMDCSVDNLFLYYVELPYVLDLAVNLVNLVGGCCGGPLHIR